MVDEVAGLLAAVQHREAFAAHWRQLPSRVTDNIDPVACECIYLAIRATEIRSLNGIVGRFPAAWGPLVIAGVRDNGGINIVPSTIEVAVACGPRKKRTVSRGWGELSFLGVLVADDVYRDKRFARIADRAPHVVDKTGRCGVALKVE